MYQYQKTGSNSAILKSEAMPSQRLNKGPPVPWIAVNSLSTMIETAHCTYNNLNLNENELSLIVNEKSENLKLPMRDIDYVERLTKKQAQCNKWIQVRAGRITASRVYDVLHTDINFISIINQNIFKLSSVCETKKFFSWGIT